MRIFKQFLKSIYITQFLFYSLIGLIIASFSITFYLLLLLSDELTDLDTKKLLLFLSIDVILVIFLIGLFIRQVILVVIYRKKNLEESQLYIKFVNLFTAMALGPAIGVVVLTSLFYNLEFRTWFSKSVKDAVVNSNIVARDYENEIQAELLSDLQLISREIIKVAQNNEVKKNLMEQALKEFISIRTISNIYLFDGQGTVISSFNDQNLSNFRKPDSSIYETLDKNQAHIFRINENSISAYRKIFFFNNMYLQVNRNLSKNIWSHIIETRKAYELYSLQKEKSAWRQVSFSIIFILFSLCFILVAVLVGFRLAERLSKPITNLIKSANEIAKGNFEARVSEEDQFEEIGILLKSYNKMINEIKNKQNLLISKSNEDEKKRLFIETILSLLTTGVISLDSEFKINLVNKSALKILQKKYEDLINKNLLEIFPEWIDLIQNFKEKNEIFDQNQIEYNQGDNIRNLNLKIIKEINENKVTGYVVTLDDMTSLILAEKHAAWSNIARKIAHEVKNPLTPIKLSAERIERKFGNSDLNNNEISILAQTISKQVDDIDRLVDEFSSFARMPKAEMKIDNFSEAIKECFNLFSNAHSKINFKIISPEEDISFLFDRFQITQVLNNLFKNSVEAVTNIHNPSIKIHLFQQDKKIFCSIIDNGVGFNNKKIRKYFEPYYTTKGKGTGLGLSIVKKIVEDHKGIIKIEKNTEMAGTTATIVFNSQ